MNKRHELGGNRYGRWLVLRYSHSVFGKTYWICQCDCGEIKEVAANDLKNGSSQSCGCLARELTSVRRFQDLKGRQFGHLTVLQEVGRNWWSQSRWLCKCDCGRTVVVTGGNLTSCRTYSCGHTHESHVAHEVKKYIRRNYDGQEEYKPYGDLLGKNNHGLAYDAYIESERAYVEVNGEQHYGRTERYYPDEKSFKNRQELDRIKKQFAERSGVFIEIDIRKYNTPAKAISYLEQQLAKASKKRKR